MILVLFRHGIAEELVRAAALPGNPVRTDEDRALTDLGRRRVRRAARGLRQIGVRADAVVHSGLVRALQTAVLVAHEVAPKSAKLLVSEALRPGAPPGDFFDLLPRLRGCDCAIAVGHAPHLDRLLALACGDAARPFTELGKAAAAAIEVPTSGRPAGRLLWLLPPKLLRRLGR